MIFSPNANDWNGAVDLLTPDGKRLRSRVLGISYFSPSTGESVLVAELRDAAAVLFPPNVLVYADAFASDFGLAADLEYVNTLAGLEQNLILRTRLNPPDTFGLPGDSVLQLLTEFFEAPEPEKTSVVKDGQTLDRMLRFGEMSIGLGKSFLAGDRTRAVVVDKQWTALRDEQGNQRTFLIEQLPYARIAPLLATLPEPQAAHPLRNKIKRTAATKRFLPERKVAAVRPTNAVEVASAPRRTEGWVLDYSIMGGTLSNFTFQADTTYYIPAGGLGLTGVTTLEGGTVIKFTNALGWPLSGAALSVYGGSVRCQTAAYRPVVLTAKDDDTVGEIISGSTGNPSGYYGDNYASLSLYISTVDLARLRFSHLARAVAYAWETPPLHYSFTDCQFTRCGTGLMTVESQVFLRNVLMFDVKTNFSGFCATNVAEHLTVNGSAFLYDPNLMEGSSLRLTNSLLVAVTNLGLTNLNATNANFIWLTNDPGVFQTVGAGAHYLAEASPYADAGTTNLSAGLLASLKYKVTSPPLLLTNQIDVDTVLAPVAARDTNAPDLGYHYDPLDYVMVERTFLSAMLTLTNGVALGCYGVEYNGFDFASGAVLRSEGTPTNLNRWAWYNTVQEQATTNWSERYTATAGLVFDSGGPQNIHCRFTDFSIMAADFSPFPYAIDGYNGTFSFRDCQFHGGGPMSWVSLYPLSIKVGFTNCLFERVNFVVGGVAATNTLLHVDNSLFVGGIIGLAAVGGEGATYQFTLANNLFDRTVTNIGPDLIVSNYHNAYVTNEHRLPDGVNDILLTSSPAYEMGTLGRFYYPTNLPLLDAGSHSAAAAGLYHFTTTTNNVKETNSTVDIGFHYVACDANGAPLDDDSDGLPDYEEDANGDGLPDTDDTDYDGVSTVQEWLDGTDPFDPASVVRQRLGHWRFNTTNFLSEAGFPPTSKVNVTTNASWSTNAALIPASAVLRYRDVETNFSANINCRNGTVRFWFKPNWSSTSLSGTGPTGHPRLLEMGYYSETEPIGLWQWGIGDTGIAFATRSNGIAGVGLNVSMNFSSHRWYQMTMTYSPTNMALYTNGMLAATGTGTPFGFFTNFVDNHAGYGLSNWPNDTERGWGFTLGNEAAGHQSAQGQFEELETYNYPLTAQEIARDFPNFGGAENDVMLDTDYDGRSDWLETHADDTDPNDPNDVVPCRLAFFRFNETNWLGELGQLPLEASLTAQAASWSGNALAISGNDSYLRWRDVETNGWANCNARSGSVSFWFKPDWNGGAGPTHGSLLYLGDGTNGFDLRVYNNGGTGQIRLFTSTNGVLMTNFAHHVAFTSNRWQHITVNYSPSRTELYTNGVAVFTNGTGISQWPNAAERASGLFIGNHASGSQPANGQFEEVETFNSQLSAADIARSFSTVTNVDSDLNGIADILEDLALSTHRPFIGTPFVVTGVMEAEQFDKGGAGIAYSNTTANAACDYRATGMFITNCTDKGGGYCLDQMRSNEWVKYTIDVRVGQNYWIEPRVAGIGTNGVFKIEFYNNGSSTPYTNTGNLTIGTTNWTNQAVKNIGLAAGTNVMRLLMLTNGLVNGTQTNAVGKFNYISIYPSWNEGFTSGANADVTGLTTNDSSWTAATNNTMRIRAALSSLGAGGGTITIPAGTFYVTQIKPNESAGAWTNAVLNITTNNVEIRGAGPDKTNTTLVGYNRVTTFVYVGLSPTFAAFQCTNVILRNVTLAGNPHMVSITNSTVGGFTNYFEKGGYNEPDDLDLGAMIGLVGKSASIISSNLLIENCRFQDGYPSVAVRGNVTDLLVRSNEFIFEYGTNAFTGETNSVPTNSLYTSTVPWGRLGIFCEATWSSNLVIVDNTFNGNPNQSSPYTNGAADGIVWFQGGGNWFVGRNAITNYALEGVQFNSGPAAVAQCDFKTAFHGLATCALNSSMSQGAIAQNDFLSFVGNTVNGGRHAVLDGHHSQPDRPFKLICSGNYVQVENPRDIYGDEPGAVATLVGTDWVVISGNTLAAGGYGVNLGAYGRNTNVIILKNDFGAANHGGIASWQATGRIRNVIAAKNIIGQGVSSHLKMPYPDSAGSFLIKNNFVDAATNSVPPFIDAAISPVHIVP